MSKRFIATQYPGIRKDSTTGKFQARKSINGKMYQSIFSKISEAKKWRSTFNPLVETQKKVETTDVRLNGVDTRFNFKEVWDLYQRIYLPSIEVQSVRDTKKRASSLFPDFYDFKMTHINAELIDEVMIKKVKEAKIVGSIKRLSFDKELQTLRAVLNWYRENYDYRFVVPILKRHFQAGVVRKKLKTKVKKLTLEQVMLFLDSFEVTIWRDIAKIQFYMAGRVQEAAGLQWRNVDLEKRCLTVSDVAVFGAEKNFEYLKEIPKNGQERIVPITDEMFQVLTRRLKERNSDDCSYFRESNGERLDFVFHLKGQPLGFRQIQYRYNKALKNAGLFPEFKGTHILRKAMANIVRQSMGLDAAQAVGGWKSREVVEKTYTDSAPTELSLRALNKVQDQISKIKLERLEQVGTKTKKF
ncbi:MAG: hypothetical protein CME70_00545 [Halobacteriovorax sp.]|nr:hypothetical protein [Halobacteriovorax sp.]|tara:strand:+ start:58842 stop:60083 length:1242 start_codon:yes stop_codon:yes gene_type:complete